MNRSTEFIINQFKDTYNVNNLWRIEFDINGECINNNPALPDFGDISPFLIMFNQKEIVKEQFNAAKKFISNGLYTGHGYGGLFYNHDWLLGLIDAFRQTNDVDYLNTAIDAVNTIVKKYYYKGHLLDYPISFKSLDAFLGKVNPYNTGYIELFLELYDITSDKMYYELSQKLLRTWSKDKFFIKHGLFSYIHCSRSKVINSLLNLNSSLKLRLFKSNTNLVYSLLSMYEKDNSTEWKQMLQLWLNGFERYFFNEGKVKMFLLKSFKSHTSDLKAGFSSFDVLCDYCYNDINRDKAFYMAEKIYRYWSSIEWENGLWPITESRNENHLDANVDFAVALTKFYAITKNEEYWNKFLKARESIRKFHKSNYGYVNSINSFGEIVDTNIKTKYQSLIIKLDLFPSKPVNVYKDKKLKLLVRDR